MSSLLDEAYELAEKDEFGHRRMGGAPVSLARNSAAAKAVPEARQARAHTGVYPAFSCGTQKWFEQGSVIATTSYKI